MSNSGYRRRHRRRGKPLKKGRWVTKQTVKHWRSGKEMRRRDGKPFVFFVYDKK